MTEMDVEKPRILYVDDDKENLTNFKYTFRNHYAIHLALSAKEAYEIMRRHDIQLVIADQRMPVETGVEFLERILPEYPNTIRMIVTAYSDINAVIHAINRCRIHYYFKKPWDEEELRMVMDDALETARSRKRSIELMAHLQETKEEWEKKITGLREKVKEKSRLLDEIKSAGERLRISEERFRAVFEAAEDGIFVKNVSLTYTQVNPSMQKLLEMEEDAIVGKTDEELFDRDLAGRIRDLEKRVLEGQSIEAEHSVEVNGNRKVLSCIRMPLREASGEVTGVCGIIRDVTDRVTHCISSRLETGYYVSEVMKSTVTQVLLAAQSDSTVLFLGESGSGKDYLAKYLHDQSRRSGSPYFTINCAALAPDLVDSELFGHERGAFTGSRGRKRGLLELAEGGTLLLNEVGELTPPAQAKLLTFLDTRSFTRVGGEVPVTVNARLVAATSRDLETEAERGNFRKDLLFRLNVFPIIVPPLRLRSEDLPMLVENLLHSISRKFGLSRVPVVDADAMEALSDYEWPGNVRELENVLERALILSDKNRIAVGNLSLSELQRANDSDGSPRSFEVSLNSDLTMNEIVDRAKHFLVSEGLRRSGGSVSKAAILLGISRGSLNHYVRRLSIGR